MHIDFLLKVFEEAGDHEALIWKDQPYTYTWLLARIAEWRDEICRQSVPPGAVTVLEGDFSPNAVALFLALVESGCILVPLTPSVAAQKQEFMEIAQAEFTFVATGGDSLELRRLGRSADHPIFQTLRQKNHPGLVLFSSGSTGKSKGAVHDLSHLLKKFRTRRHNLRTLTFLLFDHIGGLDTLFYSLSNGSCVITVEDRSPDAVCRAVERFNVEVLPVTPTFLNLLILSESFQRFSLASLKYITYGTEVMPESTLKRCAELFPQVTLLQKYGTTEVGTLRSKSKSSDSLWVKVGGEGYQTRVVDGILQIKAESAMVGYLNAPSPFTEDGWFITGDAVEVDGEYLRFLGRKTEIINVGGEKVYPAEVESIVQSVPNVSEVTVYGEKNPLVGNIVCAKVTLQEPEDPKQFAVRLKKFCRERLQSYKVPVKVAVVETKQHTERFKKARRA
ncbi:MAG: long-chain fatty acid--CoA ligase [Candidatus Hydrogenedentes bacterium]|nr:long-chain fatty acid--CoA ligase [Candidatus Hydrogenedentota bacterium]